MDTQIGFVKAIDEDSGDNAVIDYAIIGNSISSILFVKSKTHVQLIDGNDDRIFDIVRGENNESVLILAKRLDREFAGQHLLTIKCFRPYERNVKSKRSKYDSMVRLLLYKLPNINFNRFAADESFFCRNLMRCRSK